MLRRAIALLVFVALLASACTGGSDTASEPVERNVPEASILPPAEEPADGGGQDQEPPPEENPDDGRLVVQSADFQLSTMLPDGTEAAELTDPGTINSQPVWAPDGSRLAWVAVDEATNDATIATDRFDRSDFREVDVDQQPFYLYWDPSASRIAHLGPSPAGFDLSVAEPLAEDGPTNRRVDRGAPFFFSWGPDGDELLVHASGFRFDRIDLVSATVIVDEFPAQFGAPTWLEDDSIVFADVEDEQQFLITAGPSGEGRRPLVTYVGALRFSVSNQGNRIVMQAVPSDDEDPLVTASADPIQVDGEAIPVAFQQPTPAPEPSPTPGFDDSLDEIDQIEVGIPYIMGTFGGEPFPLSSRPALGLFPSPDGQATAFLEEAIASERGAMTLVIDVNGQQSRLPPFVPSSEFRGAYLPFFDQYSQSHDFWSPSSNLFVYAGRPADTDEEDGIWVYDRTTGSVTRIADGVVASFTRTPQAGGARSAL